CDPIRYQLLGAEKHASCAENLKSAMAEFGHDRIEIPQPINLFMNVTVEPDGSLTWGVAPTKAGDDVLLRSRLDAIVVASACPQDLNEINNYRPSSIGIEVLTD